MILDDGSNIIVAIRGRSVTLHLQTALGATVPTTLMTSEEAETIARQLTDAVKHLKKEAA